MRADLSKVTFANYEVVDEFELVVLPPITSASNRQHTLLFQSRRIQRTSGPTVPIQKDTTTSHVMIPANRPEMSKLTFLNVFDNHKPEDIEKLDRLYYDFKGQLPSRRQLSAIAQSIGIQQSKIKKWFDKRNYEIDGGKNVVEEDLNSANDQFWDELDLKLNRIDQKIHFMEENLKK